MPANRKFRKWYLVDTDGQEHLAVHTTKLDNSGHFTYEAVIIHAACICAVHAGII